MNKYRLIEFRVKNIYSLICKHNFREQSTVSSETKTTAGSQAIEKEQIDSLIDKYGDKILYNCVIEKRKLKSGYHKNKAIEDIEFKKLNKLLTEKRSKQPFPIYLKYLYSQNELEQKETISSNNNALENDIIQFPFETVDKITITADKNDSNKHNNQIILAEDEVSIRKEQFEQDNYNWMTDYENYNDSDTNKPINWIQNYGTADPESAISNIPCGGCGALLHCKDSSIPGYIPSEIYKSHQKVGGQKLQSIICQRCHFLKNYNTALQVRISADDYPKVLEKIQENKNALVILMVDLLDFPCSIWPDIINIVGIKRPVVVVGNKVDLLPKDSKGYLNKIKTVLENTIQNCGLTRANIKHISLISAKTGYGVEELITKLHNIWEYKGDVYLIGCTNVGKSTLFNVLLQSDYCKVQAVDLIQRATTSLWPGTTLNLLKFPILRPSGWRLYVRNKRLMYLSKLNSQENRLRKTQFLKTGHIKYATLMGNIERTFNKEEPEDEIKDIFSIQGQSNASGQSKIGLNENNPVFKLSKWCYDTPGVVQPDQILHLLTTDELMLTLPKQLIQPRTFSIRPGNTIFLAGLGRVDYVDGSRTIRFTIFASNTLPVTVCSSADADTLYNDLIGSKLFQVPIGIGDRLKKWPQLQSEEITLTGIDWEYSCADIILSSAGWISVSIGSNLKCQLKVWTPEKRGIYIRESILPKAASLRGQKIRHSPAYRKSKIM